MRRAHVMFVDSVRCPFTDPNVPNETEHVFLEPRGLAGTLTSNTRSSEIPNMTWNSISLEGLLSKTYATIGALV